MVILIFSQNERFGKVTCTPGSDSCEQPVILKVWKLWGPTRTPHAFDSDVAFPRLVRWLTNLRVYSWPSLFPYVLRHHPAGL